MKDKKYIALHQSVIDEGIVLFRLPDCGEIITEGSAKFKDIIPDFIVRDEEIANHMFTAFDCLHSSKMCHWMGSKEYSQQYDDYYVQGTRKTPPQSVADRYS